MVVIAVDGCFDAVFFPIKVWFQFDEALFFKRIYVAMNLEVLI